MPPLLLLQPPHRRRYLGPLPPGARHVHDAPLLAQRLRARLLLDRVLRRRRIARHRLAASGPHLSARPSASTTLPSGSSRLTRTT
eukprot:4831713-Prymnesium_polylepis.1